MDTIDTSELLSRYPHIADKIRTLWSTKECRALLMALLNDTREGSRAGFPQPIAKIIFSLLKDHDAKFPQFDDKDDLPFKGVRIRPVLVQQVHDWGIIGATAKMIMFVLITVVLYKIYIKH
jgi:hypothetical protein